MLNCFVLEKSFNGQMKRSAVKGFVLKIYQNIERFFQHLVPFFKLFSDPKIGFFVQLYFDTIMLSFLSVYYIN